MAKISKLINMELYDKSGTTVALKSLERIDLKALEKGMNSNLNDNIFLGECSIDENDFKNGVINKKDFFDLSFNFIDESDLCNCFAYSASILNVQIDFSPVPKSRDEKELKLEKVELILYTLSEKSIIIAD